MTNKTKMNKLPLDFSKFIFSHPSFSNIHPISYSLTGASAYGLSTQNSKEYVGIHLTNTKNYLQHSAFRQELDIIRFCYDDKQNLVSEDSLNKSFSITSFEMEKFISLYLKGSIVIYDILYLSPIYNNPDMVKILNDLRRGINNKIGFNSKTYSLNNWKKDRTDQKKIVMSYYRLLQAIVFLRKEEYVSNIDELWEDPLFKRFTYGKKIFHKFKASNFERTRLSEKEVTGAAKELEQLIDEINKASIATRLPDLTSKDIISSILDSLIQKRLNLIFQN